MRERTRSHACRAASRSSFRTTPIGRMVMSSMTAILGRSAALDGGGSGAALGGRGGSRKVAESRRNPGIRGTLWGCRSGP
ncbi:MAG: hypothetical protein AMXMBFR23_12020 [Chloroflexota bacterium]